jgi:phosphotransferase system enzyme I (PtsI)
MIELRGIPASPGIAQCKVLVLNDDQRDIPRYSINEEMVASEYARYSEAVAKAIQEIEDIKLRSEESEKSVSAGEMHMLDTHKLMLSDPDLGNKVQAGLV